MIGVNYNTYVVVTLYNVPISDDIVTVVFLTLIARYSRVDWPTRPFPPLPFDGLSYTLASIIILNYTLLVTIIVLKEINTIVSYI